MIFELYATRNDLINDGKICSVLKKNLENEGFEIDVYLPIPSRGQCTDKTVTIKVNSLEDLIKLPKIVGEEIILVDHTVQKWPSYDVHPDNLRYALEIYNGHRE